MSQLNLAVGCTEKGVFFYLSKVNLSKLKFKSWPCHNHQNQSVLSRGDIFDSLSQLWALGSQTIKNF